MVFPLDMEEADIRDLLLSVDCKPQKIKYGEQAIHVWFWEPVNGSRSNAMELAYKFQGRLTSKVELGATQASRSVSAAGR